MKYTVYAGMTTLYEQEHQYKALLKRFDFDSYCSYFLTTQAFADYLKNLEGKWTIEHKVCGLSASTFGLHDILVEIRIYINFESETDAIQFKLTYEPNKSEY